MNILTHKLPKAIIICDEKYHINTDFRVWITFEEKFEELKNGSKEAFVEICKLCFKIDDVEPFKLPPTWLDTAKALFAFYCGYDDIEELKDKRNEAEDEEDARSMQKSQRIYSFSFDAEYIYAAFLQQYGIDLTETNMHWWKFKALFSALTSETKMHEIMGIRAVDISKITDKDQRAHYLRAKRIYALPDMRSEEEKEADFADALW